MPTLPVRLAALRWTRVSLLGALLVGLYTWPLAGALNRVGRVDSFDGQYGLWQATWVARALVTDPVNVYNANIFYPHRSTLAFSEPTLLAGMLGLPAYLVTASPYATHNLAVLGFFLLAFLSAYALGRALTGATVPAIACGISYAFSPYMFARTAQLPMMGIFGLPLCALAVHRLVQAPSIRTGAGVALALFLQALACGYYTVFAVLLVGFGTLYFGLLPANRRNLVYWRSALAAAAMSIVWLLPLFWPHLQLAEGEGFSRPVDEAVQFAADWRAWLASSAWAHRWMLPMIVRWNEVLFPGFVPVVFGFAGAILGLRGRLRGPERPVTQRALAGFYVLLAVLAIWLAFGPPGGLYTVLYNTLPLFAFIRAAGRFGIVATLAFGVLMALAMAHVSKLSPIGERVVIVATVLLAAELYSAPRPLSAALPVSNVYRVLAGEPRGPVAEFPMFPRRLELNATYVLMSTTHWQPLVNGYGAFWPADLQWFAAESAGFPSVESLELLRKWGVRYVVVHPVVYERHGLATAKDVIARLDALQAHLTFVASDRSVRLYQLNGWIPHPKGP
jgi:hypothetical protein